VLTDESLNIVVSYIAAADAVDQQIAVEQRARQNACSNQARSSFSGAIDARPLITPNSPLSRLSASLTSSRIGRSGWQ
jgi:hypothetical protein